MRVHEEWRVWSGLRLCYRHDQYAVQYDLPPAGSSVFLATDAEGDTYSTVTRRSRVPRCACTCGLLDILITHDHSPSIHPATRHHLETCQCRFCVKWQPINRSEPQTGA